ncbi:Hachiman antiphage defense system protein HamA [Bacillus wiedmannii]
MLVSKKVKHFDNIPEKDYWLDLLNGSTKLIEQLNSINIPLLCTYSSKNFSIYNDETRADFIQEYEKEIRMLQDHFYAHNNHPLKSKLNIILLLFPVKCKTELVKSLHKKLYLMQLLGIKYGRINQKSN